MAPSSKTKPSREKDKSPFSANLRRVLDERQLTGKAAAEICGVAPSVVADWLAGGMPTNALAVQRLAVALKVSFEWLLTGTTTSAEGRELTVAELFDEQDVGLSGIFKIEAKRLVKRR